MRHLTVETILEHIAGETAGKDQASVQEHIGSCDRCRQQETELRELTEFLSEDIANEPPREVLEQAIQLFQPVLRPGKSRPGRILQIARRVFDSYDQPLEGVRGVATMPRQLLYRSGPVDVDLRIEAEAGRVSLAGQLLSESESFPENTNVRLESGGAVRFTTVTNAVGEFSFDVVPEDTYHLSLELPEGELRLFCVNQASSV